MKRSFFAWTALLSLFMALFAVSVTPGAQAQAAQDDPAQVEAGQAIYETNCAGCHAGDGSGVEGRGRPLIGIANQQPDRAVHFASVAEGKGSMPPFGSRLEAEEIDAAVSYLRITFVDEPAAETQELARTGAETPLVALVGATLLGAGILFSVAGRRTRTDL